MPTTRAIAFLLTAFLLYLAANQTQVGWLYVSSALIGAVLPVAWWWNRTVLNHVTGRRHVRAAVDSAGARSPRVVGEAIHEGDEVEVGLALEGPAAQVRTAERCPLAAPESQRRRVELFIPSIPAGADVFFGYDLAVYRRGLHRFPPLELASRAPLGLFRRRRRLDLNTQVLIYPELRRLKRLELLDRRYFLERARPAAGRGSEVLGVRPYRTGDSPRHIHWPSVARMRRLVSKEFADEAQPGLSLALDLFAYPYPRVAHKHTPFEWAVKAATSIGDYARRQGHPLYLAVDREVLAAPTGAVSWEGLMGYLARIQPNGGRPFGEVLAAQSWQGSAAVLIPWPADDILSSLLAIRRQGFYLLAVLLEPPSFPESGPTARRLASRLTAAGVECRLLQYDEEVDWAEQLERGESWTTNGRRERGRW